MLYKRNNLNLFISPKRRIKEFQIVETRDGIKRLVIKSPFLGKILISKSGYISLSQYDDLLYCCRISLSKEDETLVRDNHDFDIMKVFDRVVITSTEKLEKYLNLTPEQEKTELFCIWERTAG